MILPKKHPLGNVSAVRPRAQKGRSALLLK